MALILAKPDHVSIVLLAGLTWCEVNIDGICFVRLDDTETRAAGARVHCHVVDAALRRFHCNKTSINVILEKNSI